MIAPMRKVAAIAAARDADALVQRLFEAGVLHVSSTPQDSGAADLAAAKTELDGMDQAIGLLVSAQGKQQSIFHTLYNCMPPLNSSSLNQKYPLRQM